MSEIHLINHTKERQKIFNTNASVFMCRYDIENFDHVLDETRQRVFDEEMTYIAEGINRSMYSSFNLRSDDEGRLLYFDKGKWSSYVGSLMRSVSVARDEAVCDYRKNFLVDMFLSDLQIGRQLQAMPIGARMSYASPYPETAEKMYGPEFVESLGFQPKRKLGFIYFATKNNDGSVTLDTHSVDNSDDEAFHAARLEYEENEQATIYSVLAAYDSVLETKTGKTHYAGRETKQKGKNQNAWDLIQEHSDLTGFFLSAIEQLAYRHDIVGDELDKEKKLLTYGVWAALRERIEAQRFIPKKTQPAVFAAATIYEEVQRAFTLYAQRKEVLVGCGGSIKGVIDNILTTETKDVFTDIFGEETPEKWTWKKGTCRVEKCPTRPGQTEVGPCDVCRCCQKWFDKGHDPEKLYKGLNVVTERSVTIKKSSNKKSTNIIKKVAVTA